ncbi:MAG: PD-(D/E)XK nuclease family protein [Acidobacteriaceae bacterium]|nr:PD-(D/E)XK nuclease family protein [Acidobacteriaceae bacterium]
MEQLERELKDARIGPLRLDVRIDRIDAGAEGDILIDYKTGKATPNEWLGDRPDAPQLPLYAVLTGEEPGAPLEAVKFALVRAGEMKLKGLPDSVNLEEQVESWRVVLENLARDFAEGDARVNPKSYPKTCQYCAQRILCRLDPSSLEEVEEQEAEEDERG